MFEVHWTVIKFEYVLCNLTMLLSIMVCIVKAFPELVFMYIYFGFGNILIRMY
jgi:hypothetical protein